MISLAQQMIEQGWTAVVVMDDDGDARGWINERMLAVAYSSMRPTSPITQTSQVSTVTEGDATSEVYLGLTAAEIMDEDVPEAPVDIPLSATVQIMADMGVDHLFFMHNAGGKSWPASVLNLRDVVKALAGPEYIKAQGMHASRPTPMDLFRQRYNLPKK
jgi:hypothetical protein